MFTKDEGNKKGVGRFFKKIFFIVLILTFILIAFFAGLYAAKTNEIFSELAKEETIFLGKLTGKYNQDDEGRLSQDVDFNLYWNLWDALKEEYVNKEELNEQKMFYGSLRGLASSLGDPYTVFLDPKEAEEFSESLSGTFEGIGAEVGIRDDVITIIAPLEGMPASKAGLRAGDKIFAINGESTLNMSVDEAVAKIRGKKGTKVVLTVYREGMDETMAIEIERGIIYVKSITTEIRDDGIFVIKISSFNEDTVNLLNEAVREILIKNPKGIILDLRNNPGGYLDTAVEVASEWVGEEIVVIEKFSDGREIKYPARGSARLKDYPTVVLVNKGSASASEIVAGALRDYDLAKIVGEKTFGKGSVQAIDNFSDGSSVKITIAKWLTPNGDSIDEGGISPEEEIEHTLEDFKAGRDPQMDKAVEILSASN